MIKVTLKVLLLLCLFYAVAYQVSATVGGPTFIPAIAYSQSENAVYYLLNESTGKGCPSIVVKIDVNTGAKSEVKSCDDVFDEYADDVYGESYQQFIAGIFKKLEYLDRFDLNSDRIKVSSTPVSEKRGEFDELYWTNFKAEITQYDKVLSTLNLRGCSADQDFLTEGYIIPDSTKFILLISGFGDCFEGGYTEESVHLVQGPSQYNAGRNNMLGLQRNIVPGIENETNPKTEAPVQGGSEKPERISQSDKYASSTIILLIVLGTALGFGLGYMLGGRDKKPL